MVVGGHQAAKDTSVPTFRRIVLPPSHRLQYRDQSVGAAVYCDMLWCGCRVEYSSNFGSSLMQPVPGRVPEDRMPQLLLGGSLRFSGERRIGIQSSNMCF